MKSYSIPEKYFGGVIPRKEERRWCNACSSEISERRSEMV